MKKQARIVHQSSWSLKGDHLERYKNPVLFFFLAAKFIMQYYAIDAGYELHRDEFLHIDLGRHLAWGYVSVPPVTGLLSRIILLPGNSVFWVKFFPALFGALVIFVIWKTIEALGGSLFALILGATGVLLSVLLRINTLYQPNSPDYLFWALLLYVVIRYLKAGQNKWLYVASVTFALAFLNKYNIVFLVIGLAMGFLISRQRKIFMNKHLWYACALALIIILPNLIWQYRNDFPVVVHLKTLSESQLVNVNRTDFLVEQLYFFIGSLPVILLGFISFFKFPPFRKYRVLLSAFFFTLAVFTLLKAKNYYAIGLYPTFIAFGAVYTEQLFCCGWKKYLGISLLLIQVMVFLPMVQLLLPVLSPEQILAKKEIFDRFNLTRWEDGKLHSIPQDYADMLGWKELANIVDSTLLMTGEKENTLIQCDNYGQAGAINYYSRERASEALSMNADYINWYPLGKMKIKHVILIKSKDDTDKQRLKERPLFEEVSLIDSITNPYAREKGTRIYLLKEAKQPVAPILQQEIDKKKNRNE